MKKTNKILLGAFSITPAFLPIAVVSCGNNNPNPTQTVENFAKKEIVDLKANITNKDNLTSENWGLKNYLNPESFKTETRNLNEIKERNLLGQPFSLHYQPEDLKNWKSENDADAMFNKSSIALKERKYAPTFASTQVERNLDILEGLSKNTSYTQLGTTNIHNSENRLFTMWQDVNNFVEWGGSTSEGLIVLPKAEDINAAHKNGTTMMGTIFMPPSAFNGVPKFYDQLCEKYAGTFPAADKLVEMAKFYGFDGWFLNYEIGLDPRQDRQRINRLREFTSYLYDKSHSNNLKTELYYVRPDGAEAAKDKKFDLLALDYSYTRPEEYPEEKSLYGFNVAQVGIDGASPQFDKHSVYTFGYNSANDQTVNGDAYDLKFFSSSQNKRDPRISDSDQWLEPTKYYKQHTVINGRQNFSTSFQIGFGQKWYSEGKLTPGGVSQFDIQNNNSEAGWKNIGIQSVLPTWRYINDIYASNDFQHPLNRDGENVTEISEGNQKWFETIDTDNQTYNGSAALHYKGVISSNKTIVNKLYGTDVELKADDEFSIIVRNNNQSNPEVKIALWNENKEMSLIEKTSRKDLQNGFSKLTFKVGVNWASKKMSSFGIAIANNSNATEQIDLNVSQLSVNFEKDKNDKDFLTSLKNDGIFKNTDDSSKRNVRLSWTTDKSVDHWAIYKSEDVKYGKDRLIGLTSNNAAFIKGIDNKNFKAIIVGYDGGGNVVVEQKANINME